MTYWLTRALLLKAGKDNEFVVSLEGGREGGMGGEGRGGEGRGEEGREGGREGGRGRDGEGGMTVIHILILGIFNSNPMTPQYLNK